MEEREPQIIPKTEERTLILVLGARGRIYLPEFQRLGRKPGFLEGDKLEVAVNSGRWGAPAPARGPRSAAELLRRYFPGD